MNTQPILRQLKQRRRLLDKAIGTISRLVEEEYAAGPVLVPLSPPKSFQSKIWTAARRRQLSLTMKKRWAHRKAA